MGTCATPCPMILAPGDGGRPRVAFTHTGLLAPANRFNVSDRLSSFDWPGSRSAGKGIKLTKKLW